MAILHGTVIPVLQIDEIYFHALAFNESILEGHTNLTITFYGPTASRHMKLHEGDYEIKEIIDMLEDKPIEKVFGLEDKLASQVIASLNLRKAEIIDYLQNLRNYYELKDQKC